MVMDISMVVSMIMVVGMGMVMFFPIVVEWKRVQEGLAFTRGRLPFKDKHAILKLPIQPIVLLPKAKSRGLLTYGQEGH